LKRDFILTFITEFFVLASGILIYKLASHYLDQHGFSEYALSRRSVSFIRPIVIMGLSIGMTRYIAYANVETNNKNADFYFIAAIYIVIVTCSILSMIFYLFRDQIAFLIFGNSKYYYLILPVNLMLIGLALHSLSYSYYRGKIFMLKANCQQIVNFGIIPIAVFFGLKSTKNILMLTGIGWMIVSSLFIGSILNMVKWKYRGILPYIKELIVYGVQRVPAGFGLSALLALPATFTVHLSGMQEAGFVAFSTSLLTMTGAAFAPIGIILLPKASQLLASGELREIQTYVIRVLKGTLLLTFVGILDAKGTKLYFSVNTIFK